jgi:hypothetical protein
LIVVRIPSASYIRVSIFSLVVGVALAVLHVKLAVSGDAVEAV